MAVVFFSFSETDRQEVLLLKGRAVNSSYTGLNFLVKDLLTRWNTDDPAVIRQAISKAIYGTSKTIVFVGKDTYLSRWVPEEVEMTLASGKPVFAIGLSGGHVPPKFLTDRNITVFGWSEAVLQILAS